MSNMFSTPQLLTNLPKFLYLIRLGLLTTLMRSLLYSQSIKVDVDISYKPHLSYPLIFCNQDISTLFLSVCLVFQFKYYLQLSYALLLLVHCFLCHLFKLLIFNIYGCFALKLKFVLNNQNILE